MAGEIRADFERWLRFMRDTTERLKDIQDAVSHILKYTSQGRDLFDNKVSVEVILAEQE